MSERTPREVRVSAQRELARLQGLVRELDKISTRATLEPASGVELLSHVRALGDTLSQSQDLLALWSPVEAEAQPSVES